jgi:molybdopterin biosynthesis enzyme
MVIEPQRQRIVRLTSLGDVLAVIDAGVAAVAPRAVAVEPALGRTLAEDVVASGRPATAIALRDGWAVEAAALVDAGLYAPVTFPALPPQVGVGDPLPPGANAVAPIDGITMRGRIAQADAPVAPGDGVLAAGADALPGEPLRHKGERVRSIDLAVFAAAGISQIVVRDPRIRIACGSAAHSDVIDAAIAMLMRSVESAGGKVLERAQMTLESALNDTAADAVVAVGGTGSGRHDGSVCTLARLGRIEMHGIAIAPGETSAFGFVADRPVLLAPGRIDAALAAWLLIGQPLLARLAATSEPDLGATLPLVRKVASRLGLTELVPVRWHDDGVEPLASGYLPLTALSKSDGWITVPADSEGYPAGTSVAVRPWP